MLVIEDNKISRRESRIVPGGYFWKISWRKLAFRKDPSAKKRTLQGSDSVLFSANALIFKTDHVDPLRRVSAYRSPQSIKKFVA